MTTSIPFVEDLRYSAVARDLLLKPSRRSKAELIFEVLRAVAEGAEKPTNVMQRSNLSWTNLSVYLETLVKHQLLTREMHGCRARYKASAKGLQLLGRYLELMGESSKLELEAQKVESDRKATGRSAPSRAQEDSRSLLSETKEAEKLTEPRERAYRDMLWHFGSPKVTTSMLSFLTASWRGILGSSW